MKINKDNISFAVGCFLIGTLVAVLISDFAKHAFGDFGIWRYILSEAIGLIFSVAFCLHLSKPCCGY